jgi:hypothetical protein
MVGSRSAKWSRNSFLGLLILSAINYFEWPFSIGFNDWRGEAWTSWFFSFAPCCVFIWFAQTWKNKPLRYLTTVSGSLLLMLILLSLLMFYLPILGDQSKGDVKLLQSTPISVFQYRLYSHEGEGFGIPSYASLRQELDTPFGFKLVKRIWVSTYYCCMVKIDVENESIIKIIDSQTGSTIEAIKR